MADEDAEDGLDEAFTFIDQYSEEPISGQWVSNECFLFINKNGNINYLIGGRVMKLGSSGKKQYILGYDSKQNRLYLVDKALNVYAHRLLMSVLNFQAAIMNNDLQKALSLKPSIPESQYGKLAKFLENNGQKTMAYEMTPDLDHKFELSLALNKVDDAFKIAQESDSPEKWK